MLSKFKFSLPSFNIPVFWISIFSQPLFKSKALAKFSAVAIFVLPASSALAVGAIVYDPTNYVQAIKQVQAWEQQYQQMTQSLAKAQATLAEVKSGVDAISGNRGFGDLLNNPLLKKIVPTDLSTTLTDLNTTGQLSGKAQSLRAASALYNCLDIKGDAAQTACRALLGQNAQAQAIQRDTMALLNERTTQIDALRAQISATQDPKAIAELQARLQAEEAQVSNDQNKIILTNAMLVVNQQAAAQVEVERVNALMATNKTSVLNSFSFTGLGYQRNTHLMQAETQVEQ